MPPPPDVRVYETPQDAAEALAHEVCRLSDESIAARGRFAIALAGGSTPAALYRLLASPPYAAEIDWSRWHVLWGDERCVPPDHPDSNYGMAGRTLLDHVPIPPSHVHRMHGEAAPADAANAYATTLANALASNGRLDLVLLGVGDDGHTASLFPNTAALSETKLPVAANWVPHLNAHRITLTLPTLNRARNIAVLATGADKTDAVRRALAPRDSDPKPPIAQVAPDNGPVVWHLTKDAIADLPISSPVRPDPVNDPIPPTLHSGAGRNPGEGTRDIVHPDPINGPIPPTRHSGAGRNPGEGTQNPAEGTDQG